jgi:tRNA-splicing ligase RtcB (3'-phosphate/5'-hydroxy nucleic acid ligase)
VTPTLVEETPWRWRIDPSGKMLVPGIVFASRSLLPDVVEDRSLDQVVNVASLPGIVGASYAMPDIHWGYGFPIGGVAATEVDRGGVVSPGGVGFDISCGVRLLAAPFEAGEVRSRLPAIMDELDRVVPKGMGPGAVWPDVSDAQLDAVLENGAREIVEKGWGSDRDLWRCEDGGVMEDAAPGHVGQRARARGACQLGSLGSGNHFLEVQAVDRIHDAATANAFGLIDGQVCVMIHTGSRGLGHQVCTDEVRRITGAMGRFGIAVPDSQLACVPVGSPEGRSYLAAMAAAANFGRANRQLLAEVARRAFGAVLGDDGLQLVYDVSHNLAKLERHVVDGRERALCVHRKGATRAIPAGHADLPSDLASFGQPVLVPGSMGTASYVLVGTGDGGAFHSACHGAGRVMSRSAARRRFSPSGLRRDLAAQGIEIRAASGRGIVEEAPAAYKDVDEVVNVVLSAGLARPVARLVPLGVVKG